MMCCPSRNGTIDPRTHQERKSDSWRMGDEANRTFPCEPTQVNAKKQTDVRHKEVSKSGTSSCSKKNRLKGVNTGIFNAATVV